MKACFTNLGILCIGLFLISCRDNPLLTLTENGNSDYTIIISAGADSVVIKAADEMQNYIERISGARIGIAADDKSPSKYEIIIGLCNRIDDKDLIDKISGLDEDGFIIQTYR